MNHHHRHGIALAHIIAVVAILALLIAGGLLSPRGANAVIARKCNVEIRDIAATPAVPDGQTPPPVAPDAAQPNGPTTESVSLPVLADRINALTQAANAKTAELQPYVAKREPVKAALGALRPYLSKIQTADDRMRLGKVLDALEPNLAELISVGESGQASAEQLGSLLAEVLSELNRFDEELARQSINDEMNSAARVLVSTRRARISTVMTDRESFVSELSKDMPTFRALHKSIVGLKASLLIVSTNLNSIG